MKMISRILLWFTLFNLVAVESFLPVKIMHLQFAPAVAYAQGAGTGTGTQRMVDCEDAESLRRGECNKTKYEASETGWETGENYVRQLLLWVVVLVAVMHIKYCLSPATSCGWADAPAALGAIALIGAEVANFWTYKERATEIQYNQDQLAKHSQDCKDGTISDTDKTGRIGGYNICDQMAAIQAEKESLEAVKTAADWKYYLQLVAAIAFSLAFLIEAISAIVRAAECSAGVSLLTSLVAVCTAAAAVPQTAAACGPAVAGATTAKAAFDTACTSWNNPAPTPSTPQASAMEIAIAASQAGVDATYQCVAALAASTSSRALLTENNLSITCVANSQSCEIARGTGNVAYNSPVDETFKRKYAHFYTPNKNINSHVEEDNLGNPNYELYKEMHLGIEKNPYAEFIIGKTSSSSIDNILDVDDVAVPNNYWSYVQTKEYNGKFDNSLMMKTTVADFYKLRYLDNGRHQKSSDDLVFRIISNAIAGDNEIKKTSNSNMVNGLVGNGLGLILGPVAIGIIVAAYPGIASVVDGIYATPVKRMIWMAGVTALTWSVWAMTGAARDTLQENIDKLNGILNRAEMVTSAGGAMNTPNTNVSTSGTQENSSAEDVPVPPNSELNCPNCNNLAKQTDFAMKSIGLSGMSGLSSNLAGINKKLTSKGKIPGSTLNDAKIVGNKASALRKKVKDVKGLLNKSRAKAGLAPINIDKMANDMQKKMTGVLQNAMTAKGATLADIFGSTKADPAEQMKEALAKDPFLDAVKKGDVATAAPADTSGTGFDFNLQENKDPSLELDEMGENAISDLNIPVDDISENPDGNIFSLITTRYMKSAYPVLFEEVSSEEKK